MTVTVNQETKSRVWWSRVRGRDFGSCDTGFEQEGMGKGE